MSPRTVHQMTLALLAALGAYFLFAWPAAEATVFSRWTLTMSSATQPVPRELVSRLEPRPALLPLAAHERLEAFNRESALHERAGEGLVEFYRRGIGGGELLYAVARLDERVHVEVINADGAVPGSDASGDTIWLDGQRHLQAVVEMVSAPFAAREGMELLWAMAFGFHGAVRTSNEGSVVINGVVHRVNPWRGALCITADRRAMIGLFDAEALRGCQQAVGGGPVILWKGKLANPAVGAETDEFLPFNPLGEDFVQLDWRVTVYSGTYPKTAVCVGDLPDGRSFLVLANSASITGVELARALRDMGCHDALGGDDDTSTQAVWRGQALWSRPQRPVPDAIAVYLRR
ncbi:MAG: phosphodiester glycosidase family protein [Chloroflexaceae bacterium]